MKITHTAGMVVLAALAAGCKKGDDGAAARAATQAAEQYVREGNEATRRLVEGLRDVIVRAAPTVAPTLGDAARAREALRELHNDRTPLGRDFALYPTSFVAAVNADGTVVAADLREQGDPLSGKDVRGSFPCVAQALSGTAASCSGVLTLAEGQPNRAYAVTAVPMESNGDAGATRGALIGVMNLARMAQAVRQSLDLDHRRDRVQLSVGYWVNHRLWPLPDDPDVAVAWRVPQTLVARLPGDLGARVEAGGAATFHFTENEGRMQWGAAAAPTPVLGQGAGLVVYRGSLPM